jgi:hypothetical protein
LLKHRGDGVPTSTRKPFTRLRGVWISMRLVQSRAPVTPTPQKTGKAPSRSVGKARQCEYKERRIPHEAEMRSRNTR